MTMSNIHYQLLKLKSIQEKSFAHLMKIIFLNTVDFVTNSALIPDELEMDTSIKIKYVSTVYGHFLKFLCHFHLNNIRECQDSFQGLKLVIEEHYFITEDIDKSNAYTLLGIALRLVGDMESARQAFRQSIALLPIDEYTTAGHRYLLMNL